MGVLTDAAAFLVALAALGTSCGVLSRLRVVRWLWRQIVAAPLGRWFSGEVTEAVDQRLRAEFHPNGGSSFRDHVDARLDGLDGRIGVCEGELVEIRRQVS